MRALLLVGFTFFSNVCFAQQLPLTIPYNPTTQDEITVTFRVIDECLNEVRDPQTKLVLRGDTLILEFPPGVRCNSGVFVSTFPRVSFFVGKLPAGRYRVSAPYPNDPSLGEIIGGFAGPATFTVRDANQAPQPAPTFSKTALVATIALIVAFAFRYRRRFK